MNTTLDIRCTGRLQALREGGNLRSLPAAGMSGGGKRLIDLSSNDYLGLAQCPELLEEFYATHNGCRHALTSSASRLLAEGQDEYTGLEQMLGKLYGRAALLYNSGYHANTGTVAAIANVAKTLIVADRLVHASIIDGIKLSGAKFTRFRHNDPAHLRQILERESPAYEQVLVIVESVYSMDGDRAPLDSIAGLKHMHPGMVLYVDEAHALGVEGPCGLGLAYGSKVWPDVDVVIGTFGKACASMGACAIVSEPLKQYLVNSSRSLIFSTAMPPATAAWTSFILGKCVSMHSRREHLRALSDRLAQVLADVSGVCLQPSHIQPFVVGSPQRALLLSGALLEEGFKVLPIRRPTVPPGTDRLRISLNANLSTDDIDRFGNALRRSLNDI